MLAIILLSGVLVYIMYLTNGPIGMGFSFFLMMAAQPATETQFLTKKTYTGISSVQQPMFLP